MSWLLKSLQINDADSSSQSPSPELSSPDDASVARGGVKDDLSVLGHTIGRQLRGVAAFLAPPPSPPTSPSTTSTGTEDVGQPPPDSSRSSQALIGIRNDLEEISGSFKSGLSLLSSKKAVSEISKFASSLLPFQNQEEEEEEEEEEDDDDFENDEFDEVPGITQEVLDFVKEISIRPECWTDFPLTVDNDSQKQKLAPVVRLKFLKSE